MGSSAISSCGRADSPMAMSARWRMPPENSCGYWPSRFSASARPASSRSSAARAFAALPFAIPLASNASSIWNPTFHTGLRLDIGSCGTRPIFFPRSATNSRSGASARSCPSNRIRPPVTFPVPGSRLMIAWAVVDLPEPDSPTIATVCPGYTVRLAPRTAGTSPEWDWNDTSRSRISSSGTSSAEFCGPAGSFAVIALTSSGPWGRARPGERRPS